MRRGRRRRIKTCFNVNSRIAGRVKGRFMQPHDEPSAFSLLFVTNTAGLSTWKERKKQKRTKKPPTNVVIKGWCSLCDITKGWLAKAQARQVNNGLMSFFVLFFSTYEIIRVRST